MPCATRRDGTLPKLHMLPSNSDSALLCRRCLFGLVSAAGATMTGQNKPVN